MCLLPAVCLALAACSDPAAARALEAAAPFREDHRRFADWAERTLASEPGRPRSRAELEETLFAPLILESRVVGARVLCGERTFEHADPIPETLDWQVAREGDSELRVAMDQERVVIRTLGARCEVLVAFRASSDGR